ncbi:MAG: glycosyltransferase family 2 protein, partial [Cytophagales bacterium]|nr:glycosyltransferase family 2 protein [Cytophagales bacterium]
MLDDARCGVSVVICCYNSASRLPETLRHMAAQRVDAQLGWEVVLVNNNSADDTAAVARQTWSDCSSPAPLRIVEEANPGLSHARQKGIETARYEFVLLCDDDNWLNPDYVQLAYAILHGDQRAGILGGRSEAVGERALPDWFEPLQAAYAVGRQYGYRKNGYV